MSSREAIMNSSRAAGGLRRFGALVLYLAVLIGVWWAFVKVSNVQVFLIPGPDVVAISFINAAPYLAQAAGVTLYEAFFGFVIAVVGGSLLSASMVYSKAVRSAVLPLLSLLNALPKVALAPLLVIWLGLEIPSKVAMAALISFFPIVINMYSGLNNVDVDELKLFRLLQASEFQTFLKLRLANAVPALFDGMKIALPLAVIGAIVGEFVAAQMGIGYEIELAGSQFDMGLMFASVLTIAILTTILFQLLGLIEGRVLRWRPSDQPA
ncbi:MAG: ABC transporter permease [Candidatus Limnocylindrales bacterium]